MWKAIWMRENLKTTKYNDGTAIPNIKEDNAWAAATSGAYSDYNNTPANSTTYGRLYNWYTIDINDLTKMESNGGKNVCPTDWHVPSDAEWTTLTDYLTNSGYGYEGGGKDIAKSMANILGWRQFATSGYVGNDQVSNNSSGFTALPSGYRNSNGTYANIGEAAYWWCSTEGSTSTAYLRFMFFRDRDLLSYDYYKLIGFSVRCLKD
jgi:uncharacterized protein (TIGR02145 family)